MELKPCPFCGGYAILCKREYSTVSTFSVVCTECNVKVDACASPLSAINSCEQSAMREAIDRWNRRADDGTQAD